MAALTAEVSNALGRPAIATGTSVRLGHGWVGVDEACGGIRSLQAAIMLALFLGEWLRFSWPRRGWLVGAGIGAALLGNFLRILFLSLRSGAGEAAFLAAHDIAGWLALALSLALTGFPAYRWARAGAARKPAHPAPRPGPDRAEPGAPAGNIGSCSQLGSLAADEAAACAWYARGAHGPRPPCRSGPSASPSLAPHFQPATLGEEARAMLGARPIHSWYLAAGYGISAAAYYIEWHKGQAARFVPFLHNPTVCLPLAGCELEKAAGRHSSCGESARDIPFHAYHVPARRRGTGGGLHRLGHSARGRPLEKPAEDSSAWLEPLVPQPLDGKFAKPGRISPRRCSP